jgi:hypothetical protein
MDLITAITTDENSAVAFMAVLLWTVYGTLRVSGRLK